jgi:hypothetical protein
VVILGTLERVNMRRFNLRSVAKQYGMRQARIEARRGRRIYYNPPPMNTYNKIDNTNNNRCILFASFLLLLL